MSDFASKQLNELLQVAEIRPLTKAEQTILQELLAKEDGRLAASAHHYLRTHYVATGRERHWPGDALVQISAKVDQEAARRSRRQQRQSSIRQIAWAAAAITVFLGFLLVRLVLNQPAIEPAAQLSPTVTATATATPTPIPTSTPTATPQPTPTLTPNYVYADLMTAAVQPFDLYPEALYALTVAEAAAQWPGDLYLPRQMLENWTFAGAFIDETNSVLELAFVQENGFSEVRWILSQTAAAGRDLTPPLPVSYQPLLRIDETNIYDDEERPVGAFPAYAYQYEYVYREGNEVVWTVYNTITWQQDGQLFTLTLVDDGLNSTRTIASVADKLQLYLIERR